MENVNSRGDSSQEPRRSDWPISPLAEEDFDAGAADLYSELGEGTRDLNITRTLLHHPALLKAFTDFGFYFLETPLLSIRDRELMVLRLAWLCRCEYVWGQHVARCQREGIEDIDPESLLEGSDAETWSPRDRVLIRAVDELHRDAKLSEVQGRSLAAFYDPPRVIEAIFTVGQYGLICRIANSCEIPLDPGLAGFPERT